MPSPTCLLPITDVQARQLSAGWLMLGVASLVGAGLFSILLVLSRTPGISNWIPWLDFFHTALVIHVDLSVLVWFLAFASVLWSANTIPGGSGTGWVALGAAGAGMMVLIVAPFAGAGQPLLNNYVPVLQHPLFMVGLALFGGGIALQVLYSLLQPVRSSRPLTVEGVVRFAILSAAAVTLLALLAVAISYYGLLDSALTGENYYEYLFWGGGHILQFNHTLLMLVAWLWLAQLSGATWPVSPRVSQGLLGLVVVPVLAVPWIYGQYPVASAEHRWAFTELMKYGGLASLPLGAVAVWMVLHSQRVSAPLKPCKAALLASIGLFAVGGILGFMIEGVNVVIPAHYHGSIVGVTLAFMGLSYYLIPYLGFPLQLLRTAHVQPYLYASGQLMHIIGLAWSGGYGVQRKTAGSAQGLDSLPEIAGMALMGLGGLISVIGGLLFVVVAIHAFGSRRVKPDY